MSKSKAQNTYIFIFTEESFDIESFVIDLAFACLPACREGF